MAVTQKNGSYIGKDQQGNVVIVRGWTDNDIAKVKKGLADIKTLQDEMKASNVGQRELAYVDYTVVDNQANMPAGVYFLVPFTKDNQYIEFDKKTGKPTNDALKVDHFSIMYKSTGDDATVSQVGTQDTHTTLEGVAFLGTNQTFTGENTFEKPVSIATPTAVNHATTKKYVDDTIADKDSKVVHIVGNENVAGVKNFASSPLVPTTELNSLADNQVPSAKVVKSALAEVILYSDTKPTEALLKENTITMYPAEDVL